MPGGARWALDAFHNIQQNLHWATWMTAGVCFVLFHSAAYTGQEAHVQISAVFFATDGSFPRLSETRQFLCHIKRHMVICWPTSSTCCPVVHLSHSAALSLLFPLSNADLPSNMVDVYFTVGGPSKFRHRTDSQCVCTMARGTAAFDWQDVQRVARWDRMTRGSSRVNPRRLNVNPAYKSVRNSRVKFSTVTDYSPQQTRYVVGLRLRDMCRRIVSGPIFPPYCCCYCQQTVSFQQLFLTIWFLNALLRDPIRAWDRFELRRRSLGARNTLSPFIYLLMG